MYSPCERIVECEILPRVPEFAPLLPLEKLVQTSPTDYRELVRVLQQPNAVASPNGDLLVGPLVIPSRPLGARMWTLGGRVADCEQH